MTLDPAVNLAALLAGIDPAKLNMTPVDPRAALTALLAGIPASTGDEARAGGASAAHPRRAAAARA